MFRGIRPCLLAICVFLVTASAASAAESFNARGSVEQVYATGLVPGTQTSLLKADGGVVATKPANGLGGVLFRGVTRGPGYRVRSATGETSGPLTVLSPRSAPPSKAIYDQKIPNDGYGYMTTRDGIQLSYSVHPPQDVTNVQGVDLPHLPVDVPTPTLIEYSGYGYANPAGPQSGIATLANLMGYTVVDVNMRGTGCSGGAFDFFEPLQNLDGYDIIETVASQPWVKHGRVGMLGISYGGISQLFTAQTRPPSLAAITPLSVIDAAQTTLYPGGILNTGFAFNWAKERQHEAMAAGPDTGQGWAYQRIQEGDEACKANQALHPEAADLIQKVRDNDHYVKEVADPASPITFVKKIKVPVFMACQFTDEQTGGHCPTLARHMTGTSKKWFTFTNGTHVDSLSPEIYNRLYDFLQIYVAREAPIVKSALIKAEAPLVFQAVFGIDNMTLPPDPIQLQPTYAGARLAFERQKPIRILFDNGAGSADAGHPYPGFERSFEKFPVPGTKARDWYFAPGGELESGQPPATGHNAFTWDAGARPLTDFTGDTGAGAGGLWTATPGYVWSQDPEGSAVAYVTAPLTADTTVVGAGAVIAWVKSSAPSVDLQATISEVRPDGKETFVQSGWVRGDMRKLDKKKSRPLEPVLSLRAADVSPMPSDRFVKVTVPLYYQAHAYRPGSRIRVRISAPNGDQPIWSFGETEPAGQAQVAVGYGPDRPSRLRLPVVAKVKIPTALPPCPGLRGEPCRPYRPIAM
jgi:predicted acyl esterase